MFKIGDKVVLILNPRRCINAPIGSTATVVGFSRLGCTGHLYLDVKWINTFGRIQMDGSYFPESFKLAAQPGEQLLFNFIGDI